MYKNNPLHAIRRKIILDLLEKFTGTPSKTLARMAKRDNSELFTDIEDARHLIRLYRGQIGNYARGKMKLTKYFTHELA